ncbi:hypothetical protein FIBSPDRAFT_906043 [Athelia psychrophila]|uniref:Uncharacterized protein n=1 Tax=Athelia psychrophila TaxID=1759441 RepID=A0A167STG1_9AGAM|nr:hypothetical protein FIBSPDRAFT_906043 [Fibularhizoctonia sp. CBS 109695]
MYLILLFLPILWQCVIRIPKFQRSFPVHGLSTVSTPNTLILPWANNTTKPSSRGDPSGVHPETGRKARARGKATKRHSRRTHIVRNTHETASRLKTAVQPRSTLPKETVLVQKTYTQPELLARALDAEGSIFEHDNTLPRGGEAAACARRLEGRRGAEAGLDQLSEF